MPVASEPGWEGTDPTRRAVLLEPGATEESSSDGSKRKSGQSILKSQWVVF